MAEENYVTTGRTLKICLQTVTLLFLFHLERLGDLQVCMGNWAEN